MGWWGTGVLEGDPPLDVICGIENVTGCTDLYPLEMIEHPEQVARRLTEVGLATIASKTADSSYPGLSAQVVGAVAMAVGAPLGEFADAVRVAAERDEWARTSENRAHSMAELITMVDNYRGERAIVANIGLIDTITGHG